MLSVCAGKFVCMSMCVCSGRSARFKWAQVRDSRMQMKPLKSGSFPLYLKGHPFLYLEHHFDISPTEARPLWGFGLKWCTIEYKESSRFALYNLSSLEISTANLQQAPCLMQTLSVTYRPAWALSITFWRRVQYRGIPGIRCFQTAFAALEQLTISQHGSSSPDRLWLRILISLLAVSLPPQTIHTKCISCGESYNVLCS